MKLKTMRKTKTMVIVFAVIAIVTLCAFQNATKAYAFFQLYFGNYVNGYNYGATQMTSISAPTTLTSTTIKGTAQTYAYFWAHQRADLGNGNVQVSDFKKITNNTVSYLTFYSGYYAVPGNSLYLMIAANHPTNTDYVDGYWYK